jgi:hypothetical protein
MPDPGLVFRKTDSFCFLYLGMFAFSSWRDMCKGEALRLHEKARSPQPPPLYPSSTPTA